ncbi:hypothetical protein OH77DRAFT_1075704 [Trametes cingulata]|nr:hypothetical protein OH77DRAFT_1075704 [Trametes cingulata]
MDDENPTVTSLEVLNRDCLLQIFALLRPQGGLRPLSLTCRWLRESCMEVLFERTFADVALLQYCPPGGFPPPCLWPYLRCMTLLERFGPAHNERTKYLCPTHEDNVASSLHAMRQLQKVIFQGEQQCLPWPIIYAVLSTPTLRSLELHGGLTIDREASHAAGNLQRAPLVSLCLVPEYLRPSPHHYASEIEGLASLLEHFPQSLQTLVLFSQSTPFTLLSRCDWPQLRELCIEGDGERVWTCPIPLVSVLSRMPRLRVLQLKLALRYDQHPKPIWPQDHNIAVLPWPELESLTVSWPCVDDGIFEHLPDTLRHLSLRCWPHLYTAHGYGRTSRRKPIPWLMDAPPCADVLGALGKCPKGSALRSLSLEFAADTDIADAGLLQ